MPIEGSSQLTGPIKHQSLYYCANVKFTSITVTTVTG
jgi:hypothetical protein